jgi:hypothetical protein
VSQLLEPEVTSALADIYGLGLFVPAAVQVLLVPVLLVTAWSRPSA